MTFDHEIEFEVGLSLDEATAIAFVRDVPRSLAHVRFLRGLRVRAGEPAVVEASLPINAALFGQRDLPFRSFLTPTERGARLDGIDVEPSGPGWAVVSGEATVAPEGARSLLRYAFAITVHVRLPDAERWGTRALTRMIEYTASTVLGRLVAAFPEAIALAAREAERSRALSA